MGNSHNKINQNRREHHEHRDRQAFASQFSLSHFVGNLSARSIVSIASSHSVYSASRPWSRVSHRRCNDTTHHKALEGSKSTWPVAKKESIFLPEFPITTALSQKDFLIVNTIAKGAYGEVYKVKKISENKEFALKVLDKAQLVKESGVQQLKEEASIQLACGHHPFIASAVSHWQTKKRLYIVTEYISGGELLALLNKYKKLPIEAVKIFVAEIAIALDFLHNAGVIYRDLKPENILLDADYHIRLIDFGLSKWLSFGSRTTTICGTVKYMAPEILSGKPYGHAADWWSLGVVACRMLCNEYPTPASPSTNWEEKTKLNSTEKLDHPLPGTLPDAAVELPPPARGLLTRLLERDPKVRLRSLRQLEQSAFYMGFNFDHVKKMKVSPKPILEDISNDKEALDCFANGEVDGSQEIFATFDQAIQD